MNFHSAAIKDTLGNVRFLAKFGLTGGTSYKTCLNGFTINALYFLNIIICTSGVNIHAVITCMLTKVQVFTNPACFNSYMTLINFPSLYFALFR